jgi:hypothetical protein
VFTETLAAEGTLGMGWKTAGVTASRIKSLTYNAPSEMVVALFDTDMGRWSTGAVYCRHRAEKAYKKIFGSETQASAVDLVSADNAPLAFFSVWNYDEDGGGDWREIRVIDLSSLAVDIAFEARSFADSHDGAWVADIIACRGDGRSLLCKVGAHGPEHTTSGGLSKPVRYSLGYVDVATLAFERVTNLENPYF